MRHVTNRRLDIRLLLVAAIFVQLHAHPIFAATDPVRSTAGRELQREFGASFLDRYWRLHSDAAIAAGYYKVADLLIVPDDKARSDLLHFLHTALAHLHKIPGASLDIALQTDRAVLENQLQFELWSLTKYRSWEWDPSSYNVADPFALLLNTEYAPLEQRSNSRAPEGRAGLLCGR